MEKHLVTLYRLIIKLHIGLLAVVTVCTVNRNRTCFILDHHRTILSVSNGLDGSTDVVTLGGNITGVSAKLQSLSYGNDLVFGLFLTGSLCRGLGGCFFGSACICISYLTVAGSEKYRHYGKNCHKHSDSAHCCVLHD